MKVLLSGTSNSILAKGLSHGISSHPLVTQFSNVSLGASGVVAVGAHLPQIDFADFDLCILDYHVNEAVLLFMGLAALEDSLSNLAAICDAASRAGCMPVVTIFPLSNRFRHPRPFEEIVIEKLAPFGLPIFNLYPLVSRLAEEMGQPIDAFFLDPNHIAREIGREFGAGIVDVMAPHVAAGPKAVETGLPYRAMGFSPYGAVKVDGQAEIVQRSTRLVSLKALHIAPGTKVTMPDAPPGWELAGLSFNSARSWGYWQDSASRAKVLEPISPSLFSLKRELAQVVWPFLPHPRLVARDIELTYMPGTLSGPDRPPMGFEFTGIILRAPTPTQSLALRVPTAPPTEWAIPQARHDQMQNAMAAQFATQDTAP